ncbi:hypothetical protein I7I53_08868 [Histoplasma capsulatum var. duboisii H88]|uniref:Uncharacterized protein n=1 Tax=Ajellomyces capsulatus (strain H88) TaxID=544711 RepID=A0A8A1L8K8_AJEC8|nr:hypothetical protein I7I53_08868 [Histoplasma capsulatum var. duboisii H88]
MAQGKRERLSRSPSDAAVEVRRGSPVLHWDLRLRRFVSPPCKYREWPRGAESGSGECGGGTGDYPYPTVGDLCRFLPCGYHCCC